MTLALLALVLSQTPDETNTSQHPEVPAAAALTPAEPRLDVLREAMHTYVRGERRSIVPFGVMAISTLLAGSLLFIPKEPIMRGAAWPLLGFGVLELAAGLFFGLRNEQPKLDALLDEDPAGFVREETQKITRISARNQPLLLAVWSVLLAGGGAMAGIGASQNLLTLEGVGLGLAVQALAFFLVDWAVMDRADDYLAVLRTFR